MGALHSEVVHEPRKLGPRGALRNQTPKFRGPRRGERAPLCDVHLGLMQQTMPRRTDHRRARGMRRATWRMRAIGAQWRKTCTVARSDAALSAEQRSAALMHAEWSGRVHSAPALQALVSSRCKLGKAWVINISILDAA